MNKALEISSCTLTFSLLLVGAAAGCGFDAPDRAVPDAGGHVHLPPPDAGTVQADAGEEPGTEGPLFLALRGTMRLKELPLATEKALMGSIDVLDENGDFVTGASLTVNGVTVPEREGHPGWFRLEGADIPVVPGEPISLVATRGELSSNGDVPCPGPVVLTPEGGLAVAPNDTLTVTWTGDARSATSFLSELSMTGYDAATNTSNESDWERTSISRDAQSAELVAPETELGGYILDLKVWGTTVFPAYAGIKCDYTSRLRLTKK